MENHTLVFYGNKVKVRLIEKQHLSLNMTTNHHYDIGLFYKT